MTLNFPNPTRSYDEKRKAVRFVGHDGMFEVPFFIEAAANTTIDFSCGSAGSDTAAVTIAAANVARICLRIGTAVLRCVRPFAGHY